MTYFSPLTAIGQDPTGWDDPTLVTQSYDSTNRVVTVSGTGKLYWQGRLVHDLAGGNLVSEAHTATNGGWFYYYNGAAYVWSQTAWTFNLAMICYVNYVSATPSNSWALRECHSFMNWQAHRELHNVLGTARLSGGDISAIVLASTTAANRRPAVAATVLLDEDLQTTNPLLGAGTYTQFYVGAAGAATFVTGAADIVPLNTAVPKWNNASTGALTDCSANQYMNVWLIAMPVTSDAQSQAYRYLWVTGQAASNTRSVIDAETPANVNLGTLTTLSAEFVFLTRILIRYASGDWTVISVNTLTGSRFQQAGVPGAFLSQVTTDTTLTGTGTAADPLSVVGYASQYFEAVGSVTGTGSIQDLVNVDGETYPWIELEMYCPSHSTASSTQLWCNADNTAANYNSEEINATSTTASAANADASLCQLASGTNPSPIKMTMNFYAKYLTADRHANLQIAFTASGGTMYLRNRASRWEGTAALTKFSITAPSGAVWYYKLRARKGA